MKKIFLLVVFCSIFHISNANVVVLNGLTHVHKTTSGSIITGVIKLKNTKDTEQRIVMYFNDMFQECGKETVLTNDFSHKNSILQWISTNVNERILKPKEEYELIYTINVPENVEVDGSYWGVLMIEIEKPIKEDELEYGVKLESKVRYGIQIIMDINERTPSELDFYDIKFLEEDTTKTLNVSVQNKGTFYVQPTLILEVFNEEGDKTKTQEVKFKKIYPEFCKAFSLDISDLPLGSYSAVLMVDYGENLYSIDLEFEIK